MTDLEHKTTRELIDRVNNQNNRFRVASVVFGAVTILGLIVLLLVCLGTLSGVNRQLSQQKKLLDSQQQILSRISASSQQRTRQINDLQNHINCIVELFQQPNRQNLTITDLQGCQIDANGNVSSGSDSNWSAGSTPPQSSNSGAVPSQNTTSGGVANKTQPTTSVTPPVSKPSTLDRVPVLGRVFKALGL